MQYLTGLMDSGLTQAAFRLPTGETLSTEKLRDLYRREKWDDEERLRARGAIPTIPKEAISHLEDHIRSLLRDYVNSEVDTIGHALPIGHGHERITNQPNGLISNECVSSVEVFAMSLIKGAAVLGAKRVALLLFGWLQGKPVRYKIIALLNSLSVKGPTLLEDGVRLESLPLSTDRLPISLPGQLNLPAKEYLGRTILAIECTASPVFFRPLSDSLRHCVKANSKAIAKIGTYCQALALESNSYVDTCFYWTDYHELIAFALSNSSPIFSSPGARTKKRPYQFSLSTRSSTGVTTLRPRGERPVLELRSQCIPGTLDGLQGKVVEKIEVALTRWLMSKDFEKDLVDKFIDLRIALESLYLQDFLNEQSQEMRFRLALFGAWHLGSDFEDRRKVRKVLRDAYDTASAAVHGGDLKGRTGIQELLSDAQDLCRQGILKVLREGYPSQEKWGDLILGVD